MTFESWRSGAIREEEPAERMKQGFPDHAMDRDVGEQEPQVVHSFPMLALFEVESIKLTRWETPKGWKGVNISVSTRQGIHLDFNCHASGDPMIEVIDETQPKKALLTADELKDIEDARGPVTALCAETATLHEAEATI